MAEPPAPVSEPAFHDSADVRGYLATGSDEAGFVQVLTGQTSYPDKMMDTVDRLSASLVRSGLDLIGGTVALHHARHLHRSGVLHLGRAGPGRRAATAAAGAAGRADRAEGA